MTLLFVGELSGKSSVRSSIHCRGIYTGQEAERDIACMDMDGDAVWVSSGRSVIKYLRGKEVSIAHIRLEWDLEVKHRLLCVGWTLNKPSGL